MPHLVMHIACYRSERQGVSTMEIFEIIAEPRENLGKGVSRRLRHQGKIPGVVYGGEKGAVSIMVRHNEMLHHLEHEAFHSHILTLKIGPAEEKVVLKDLQHHPYKSAILHFDLQRVDENQQLTMRVPLHFINEDICIGVKQDGGVISHVITDMEINCLPKDLPEYIEIDMAKMNIGDGIYLEDLNMPEGTQITTLLHGGDAKQIVATVHLPKVVQEVEESAVVTEDEPDVDPEADES